MSTESILRIEVYLKDRLLKEFALSEGSALIGRDPDADVFLDNVGVSRRHARIERTGEGFFVEDLESANGTFLNEKPVTREPLKHRDVVRVGKFSLYVSYGADRRSREPSDAQGAPARAFQGTTVLKYEEIAKIMTSAKAAEHPSRAAVTVAAPATQASPKRASRYGIRALILVAAAAFALGVSVGSALVLLLI